MEYQLRDFVTGCLDLGLEAPRGLILLALVLVLADAVTVLILALRPPVLNCLTSATCYNLEI